MNKCCPRDRNIRKDKLPGLNFNRRPPNGHIGPFGLVRTKDHPIRPTHGLIDFDDKTLTPGTGHH